MNTLINTGNGTQHERMREASIGLPFAMPAPGFFIMGKPIEYTDGQKIGDLIYLQEATASNGNRKALFKCRCGSKFITFISSAKSGNSKSCGCLRDEKSRNRIKHGLHKDPLYNRWRNIKARCYNVNSDRYKYYGHRGISVYKGWINNFKEFYDYVTLLPNAMKDGFTIDRIDNNGDYEPGNIRWADAITQRMNSRKQNSKSDYTGVCKEKATGNWKVHITVNYKTTWLGTYNNIEDAIDARNHYIIDNNLILYKIQEYEGR